MSESYFARPAISNSAMKEIIRSPAHFIQWVQDLPESSRKPHFRIGQALHHRILDEGKEDRIRLFHGTKSASTFTSAAGKAFLDINHPQFICLTPDELAVVDGMEKSVRAEKRIMSLLRAGMKEVELYWREPVRYQKDDGFPVWLDAKAMLDCLAPSYIIDLKTTADDLTWFKRNAEKFYEIQASWYQHAAFVHDGIMRPFFFVGVETKPPYGVRIFEVGPEFLKRGEIKWKTAIETYAKCMAEGEWPGYNNDLIEVI